MMAPARSHACSPGLPLPRSRACRLALLTVSLLLSPHSAEAKGGNTELLNPPYNLVEVPKTQHIGAGGDDESRASKWKETRMEFWAATCMGHCIRRWWWDEELDGGHPDIASTSTLKQRESSANDGDWEAKPWGATADWLAAIGFGSNDKTTYRFRGHSTSKVMADKKIDDVLPTWSWPTPNNRDVSFRKCLGAAASGAASDGTLEKCNNLNLFLDDKKRFCGPNPAKAQKLEAALESESYATANAEELGDCVFDVKTMNGLIGDTKFFPPAHGMD